MSSSLSRWSLCLSLFGLFMLLVSVVTIRFELSDFKIGLLKLVIGCFVGIAGAIVGVISLFTSKYDSKLELGFSIVGIILGGLVAWPVIGAMITGSEVPPIHDISTDIADPPQFKAVISLRKSSDNSLERTEETDKLQTEAYPEIQTKVYRCESIFQKAVDLVKARGWEVVEVRENEAEATAITFFMGFKDDVIIRVREKSEEFLLDMRSASRVGDGDLGANAHRIHEFLEDLSC